MKNLKIVSLKTHTGAVLIVSMVMLIAITMLGVTSMKSSLTELTMAGNLRESGLTFQAAEAGLKSAESLVENTTSLSAYDGSTSLLNKASTDPDYFAKVSWTDATTANVNLKNISINPKYIIRYLGDSDTNEKAGLGIGAGYGQNNLGTVLSNFRVTARGTGQTGNFFRIVQSYYAKER